MSTQLNAAEAERRRYRLVLISEAAQTVAGDIRSAIERKEGVIFSVDVNHEVIKEIDKLYWEAVEKFRKDNQYPEGERINMPKALSITIVTVLSQAPKIFILKDPTLEKKWLWKCYFHLFNLLMIDYLMLSESEC